MHTASASFAKALFNLALNQGMLDEWLLSLQDLCTIFNQYPILFHYFASPLPPLKKKESTFLKIFKPHLPSELLHFMLILFRKRRFMDFTGIVNAYKKMTLDKLGILQGVITTPIPLDATTKAELATKWGKILNRKIALDEAVDATLLGGGLLMFENKQIDFSLKGKLQKLKKNLSQD